MKSKIKKSGRWSNMLINGIITLVIGLLLTIAPESIYRTIVLAIGVIIFLAGLFSLIFASVSQTLSIQNKSFWYIQAVINIVIGIFIFFKVELIKDLFHYFISIWLILVGAIQLFYAIVYKKAKGRASIMLINSILALAIGFILLFWPNFPLIVVGYICILISIILFYYSFVYYRNRNEGFSDNINDVENAEVIE